MHKVCVCALFIMVQNLNLIVKLVCPKCGAMAAILVVPWRRPIHHYTCRRNYYFRLVYTALFLFHYHRMYIAVPFESGK